MMTRTKLANYIIRAMYYGLLAFTTIAGILLLETMYRAFILNAP